jgi:hypothetical protein
MDKKNRWTDTQKQVFEIVKQRSRSDNKISRKGLARKRWGGLLEVVMDFLFFFKFGRHHRKKTYFRFNSLQPN